MTPLDNTEITVEEVEVSEERSVTPQAKQESTDSERSSRRGLFGLGPAALLASLAACGETQFAGKKASKKEEPATIGDDDGILGTEAGAGGPEEEKSASAGSEKGDPKEEEKLPEIVEEEFGTIDVSAAEVGDLTKIGAALYGTKDSAMLAFAFKDEATGLKEGDDLYLLRPVSKTKAFTMAMRTIWSFQQGAVPHVFDNIHLGGVDEVHVLVVSGAKKTVYKVSTKDVDFQRIFPADGKAIIDVPTNIAANHPNYYDLMPVFEFTAPSVPLGAALIQKDVVRPYKIAQNTSTWANASFDIGTLTSGGIANSALPGITMAVTDAIGRPVAAAAGSTVAIAPEILQKTNILLVYVYDPTDDHYHRYIYFVG